MIQPARTDTGLQSAKASTPTPMKSTELLGARAVRLGYVTPEQVDDALERQRERRATSKQHRLLGLLLVDQGLLSPDQLVSILDSEDHSRFPLSRDAITLAARLTRNLDESDTVIMFTGVTDGDGAGEVATHVALAFARMERGEVLLLDANTSNPSMHTRFAIERAHGFSDVLAGECTIDDATFTSPVSNLSVLPAGSGKHDIARLLLAESAQSLMKDLRDRHLFVVIHGPPLSGSPEGSLLAVGSDAVVTVLAAGRRTKAQLLEIKRTLDGLKARSLGVVLTAKGRFGRNHKPVDRSR